MAVCKIVHCPKDVNEVGRFLQYDLGPLLETHWQNETDRTSTPHGLDVPSFMAVWEQKGIVLIMAYEGDKAVGFMLAYKFMPMFMPISVLNIERWHGTESVVDDLFKYLTAVMPAMGIDQAHAASHSGQAIPEWVALDNSDTYTMNALMVG